MKNRIDEGADKVVVDWDRYHRNMSELEFFRELVIEKMYLGNKSWDEIRDELVEANYKKYYWWC